MKLKLLSGEMSAVTFIWVFLFHLIAAGVKKKMLKKKKTTLGILSKSSRVFLDFEWNHCFWTEFKELIINLTTF